MLEIPWGDHDQGLPWTYKGTLTSLVAHGGKGWVTCHLSVPLLWLVGSHLKIMPLLKAPGQL